MKLMTIDVGGTEIKYSVMDDELHMEDEGYVPTPYDSFEQFAQTIYDIYSPHKDEVEGIAMAIPGFVNFEKGTISGGGALHYNWNREVAKELSEKCGCRVVIENDGKAAARAEYAKGSLQGCRNAAVFIIGTGVGGGIIVDGHVLRGVHETAGEYSFMYFDMNDYQGRPDFVGDRCSARGLLGRYTQKTGEEIDGREFFKRLSEDENAQTSLDEFARDVAVEIINLFWLLDLEKIAIGGGISRQDILIEKIKEQFIDTVEKHPFIRNMPVSELKIVRAQYGNDANQIGAFMAYLEKETR